MSSNGGNRKSMDDVLSSIRRIIGAEKKDGYDDQPEGDAPPPPLTLGAPIAGGTEKPRETGGDALSLTPNMRVDFSRLNADAPTPAAPAADIFASPAPPAPAPEPEHGMDHDEDEDAVVIDEAALEEMIRRVVAEELDAREQAAEARMRRIVRDELAGDVGQNISRNVQSLISSEVAKLMRGRG